MDAIRLDNVSLLRRTQEEFSYDLKRTVLSILEGNYHKPSRKLVLDQVDFAIEVGEKFGIIGANGSGKSTLLKVICNILKPTSGRVRVRGTMAPLIELGAGFEPDISVFDNIILYGVMLGFSIAEMRQRVTKVLEFAELEDYKLAPVKSLSSGMAARLGFAIATEVQPDILILDEILSVGDEAFKRRSQSRLEQFWHNGTTVLLVSHDLSFLQNACERVLWLEQGRVRMIGEAKEVVQAYLDHVYQTALIRPEELAGFLPTGIDPEAELPAVVESNLPELPLGEAYLPLPLQKQGVVITQVAILNQDRQVATAVEFGVSFYVVLDYTVIAPLVSIVFGFYLFDSEGRMVLEPNTMNGLGVDLDQLALPGHHRLHVKIPGPLLVPGRYTIEGLGAYEVGVGHHYRHLEPVVAFDVVLSDQYQQEWFGQELVHPALEWSVE